ncbi:MAG: SLBB domain-containing protein, partial [bacterium]
MKNRYKYLVLFIFLFALFGSIKLIENNPLPIGSNQKNNFSASSTTLSQGIVSNPGEIVVEISGAITNPGVYTIKSDSRTQDLIDLAGGVDIAKADLEKISLTINKAQKLKDQQKVLIPTKEINTQQNISSSTKENSKLISINSGTYNELVGLNGVGDSIAKKIIS